MLLRGGSLERVYFLGHNGGVTKEKVETTMEQHADSWEATPGIRHFSKRIGYFRKRLPSVLKAKLVSEGLDSNSTIQYLENHLWIH